MGRGRWSRWGRGSCEGYGLEIGGAFRATVVRGGGSRNEPVVWSASINARELGKFPERAIAMKRVEDSIMSDMGPLLDDWTIFRAAKLSQR
jgi:hypothetical protein